MTKEELVQLLSKESRIPRGAAEIIVKTIFQSMAEALNSGEKVELRGFGSFRTKTREARMGRNPKTGEKVHVARKRVPAFRAGKELKEAVNRVREG